MEDGSKKKTFSRSVDDQLFRFVGEGFDEEKVESSLSDYIFRRQVASLIPEVRRARRKTPRLHSKALFLYINATKLARIRIKIPKYSNELARQP